MIKINIQKCSNKEKLPAVFVHRSFRFREKKIEKKNV